MVDFPLVRALTSQLEIRDALLHEGAERVGWKLGLGDSERIGGHIAVGHLTSRTCLAAGASYVPEDPAAELHADAEIAVELGRDLVPDAPTEAARRAVRGYAVALEICDLQQLPDDAQAIVAENVLHRAVAFGPWRAKLPTRMTASLLVNGEIQTPRRPNRTSPRDCVRQPECWGPSAKG